MSFFSYPHLRLLISSQMFEITVALEIFWNFKGTKHGLILACSTIALPPVRAETWSEEFINRVCCLVFGLEIAISTKRNGETVS